MTGWIRTANSPYFKEWKAPGKNGQSTTLTWSRWNGWRINGSVDATSMGQALDTIQVVEKMERLSKPPFSATQAQQALEEWRESGKTPW